MAQPQQRRLNKAQNRREIISEADETRKFFHSVSVERNRNKIASRKSLI